MELEFSFNGVSCTEMGLTYIPSRKNVTPNLAQVEVVDSTPSYRHGGYYFGHRVKPREFTLECFAEEISREKLEDILVWLEPGQEGQLVFSDRPLVHYDAVVTQAPDAEAFWDGQSPWSTITCRLTFTLTAYDPFGKLDVYSSDDSDAQETAKQYSGLLSASMMPSNTFTNMGSFLVYNPGNYESDTVIRASGSLGEAGLTIRNNTNGDVCKLLELPASPQYLEVDSYLGTVSLLPTYPDALAYAYHDEGYIRLAPGKPKRNMIVTTTSGSNQITTQGIVTKNDEGRYLYLDDQWLRIANVNDAHTAIMSENLSSTGTVTTTMATMNEISITGTGASLSFFELSCTPLVR